VALAGTVEARSPYLTVAKATASIATMRHKRFSAQIRAAIARAKVSRYRICADIGLNQATMSRFMNGNGNLSLETVDRLAELLKLRVVVGTDRTQE
jgi:hypothetical protein